MAKLIEITGKLISGEWGNDDENNCGIPVLRTTNFTNTGVIDYSDVITRTITKKNIAEKFLRKGDILIEKSGGSDKQPVGRVVYFDGEENQYLFNNFTGLLRIADSHLCDARYLFYALFANYQRGGTIPFQNKTTGLHNLKSEDYLKHFEIPLPSMEIQHQITENLDKVTHLIDLCNRILDRLDLLIKSRFVEMFGDPTTNSHKLPIVKLGDLALLITKGASPNWQGFSYTGDAAQTLFITSQNVRKGFIDLSSPKYIEDGFNDKQKRSILKKGDFLINIVGASIGRAAQFTMDCKANINQATALVRVDHKRICSAFLSVYLNSEKAIQMYESMKCDTGRANLSLQDIGNLIILLPPLALQEQFADFVKQVDQSKSTVKQILQNAELLKNSLMQKYFA